MEDIEDELLDFLVDLAEKQEPLGIEFENIINDNIDELYVE